MNTTISLKNINIKSKKKSNVFVRRNISQTCVWSTFSTSINMAADTKTLEKPFLVALFTLLVFRRLLGRFSASEFCAARSLSTLQTFSFPLGENFALPRAGVPSARQETRSFLRPPRQDKEENGMGKCGCRRRSVDLRRTPWLPYPSTQRVCIARDGAPRLY